MRGPRARGGGRVRGALAGALPREAVVDGARVRRGRRAAAAGDAARGWRASRGRRTLRGAPPARARRRALAAAGGAAATARVCCAWSASRWTRTSAAGATTATARARRTSARPARRVRHAAPRARGGGGGRRGARAAHLRAPRARSRSRRPRACSGGARGTFYHGTRHPEGVDAGVASLAAAGAPPRAVIIDDGWQHTTPFPRNASSRRANPRRTRRPRPTSGKSRWRRRGRDALSPDKAYDYLVRNSAAGGVLLRAFGAFAATRSGRETLLEGYKASKGVASFTARLATVAAGGAFGGVGALAECIRGLKERHGVQLVYCWHALLGYWGGVQPGSFGAAVREPRHTPGVLEVEPTMEWMLTINGSGVPDGAGGRRGHARVLRRAARHHRGSRRRRRQGGRAVDGGRAGGSTLAARCHAALEASVSSNFGDGNRCINCMCHSTEALFAQATTSAVRASDDFYPNDAASHSTHIFQCAYNSVMLASFAWPDWDMFQSDKGCGALHAAARAVSGAPVYVSDAPGAHSAEVLARCVLPSGRVPCASQPALPCRDCLLRDTARDGATASRCTASTARRALRARPRAAMTTPTAWGWWAPSTSRAPAGTCRRAGTCGTRASWSPCARQCVRATSRDSSASAARPIGRSWRAGAQGRRSATAARPRAARGWLCPSSTPLESQCALATGRLRGGGDRARAAGAPARQRLRRRPPPRRGARRRAVAARADARAPRQSRGRGAAGLGAMQRRRRGGGRPRLARRGLGARARPGEFCAQRAAARRGARALERRQPAGRRVDARTTPAAGCSPCCWRCPRARRRPRRRGRPRIRLAVAPPLGGL